MRHGSELRVLETLPAVASATMAWPDRSGDSDIQHDFEVLQQTPPKIHVHGSDAMHSSD